MIKKRKQKEQKKKNRKTRIPLPGFFGMKLLEIVPFVHLKKGEGEGVLLGPALR